MSVAYKHVPKEFAESFASGKAIRIGLLSAYRKMEGERADVAEGMAGVALGDPGYSFGSGARHFDVVSGRDITAEVEAHALRRLGMVIGPDATVRGLKMNNVVVANYTSDCYIFCASKEPDFQLAGGPTVFRINDLEVLAELVVGVSPGLIRPPKVAEVQYERRFSSPFSNENISPSAFRKDPRYLWEREIRIAWELATEEKKPRLDFVNVAIPKVPKGLIEHLPYPD